METPNFPLDQAARQVWVGKLLDIDLDTWLTGVRTLDDEVVAELERRDIADRIASLINQLQIQADGDESLETEAAQIYIQNIALLGDQALVYLVQAFGQKDGQ